MYAQGMTTSTKSVPFPLKAVFSFLVSVHFEFRIWGTTFFGLPPFLPFSLEEEDFFSLLIEPNELAAFLLKCSSHKDSEESTV